MVRPVFSLYSESISPVHRVDARVKICLLLAFSIAVFFVRTGWGLALFALVMLASCLIARLSFGQICQMLMPVFVLAGFSWAFHVIAEPSLSGLLDGVFFAVRMIVLVAASFVVCLTTTTDQLLDAFRSLIKPLHTVGLPTDDIAFTLALSVRFIPVIEIEFARIRAAQVARGAESARGLPALARTWAAAFAALFVSLFRRASILAQAMDARCYGAAAERTHLH